MTAPVLLVDDHRLIATTLTLALRQEGLDATWAGVPGDDLDRLMRDLDPGLVLLDLDLGTGPDGERIDGTRLIRGLLAAGWSVLVVSGTADQGRLADAIAEGAIGWVGKDAPFDRLVDSCLRAARGEQVLDPSTRRDLLARHRSRRAEERQQRDRLESLTARETEVLADLADGVRVADIAARSFVSVATVRSQVKAIRAKLGVGSQLQAAAMWRSSA